MSRYTIILDVEPLQAELDSLLERYQNELGRYLTSDEFFKDPELEKALIQIVNHRLKPKLPFNFSCCKCGKNDDTVKYLGQNTQYVHEPSNYVQACPECFKEIQEEWAWQWQDYYSQCL
jgi:hypothetical protein